MLLTLPHLSLVVLVGPSGCGKTCFAAKHFLPTEAVSSDRCRALVCDDETNQDASADAFDTLHYIVSKRLARGKLTVVDATNVQPDGRRKLIELARRHHFLAVAIVFDLPQSICRERNQDRPNRNVGSLVISRQHGRMKESLATLKDEGFRYVHVLTSPDEVDSVQIARRPMASDRKRETGPFDIIGDVHGCFEELLALLEKLGYRIEEQQGQDGPRQNAVPPPGRRAIFLGDLVDRGPCTPAVLRLVMAMVESGGALCVPGNHDLKLMRALRGGKVEVAHGLGESLEQLAGETPEFRQRAAQFIDGLVSHYVLDGGKLAVAHAGIKNEMQGRTSSAVWEFVLYGETTGETDGFGPPGRFAWAQRYRGQAMVVYGHTSTTQPEWLNRTINIDTGCVFGGKLTALRYPEKQIVSVPAGTTKRLTPLPGTV